MHIDRSLNGLDLEGETLWIERPERYRPPRIARSTRIGVDYAGDWAKKPWRFFERDSIYVSTVTAAVRRKGLILPPARPGRLRVGETASPHFSQGSRMMASCGLDRAALD